jgi:hypothetical protein
VQEHGQALYGDVQEHGQALYGDAQEHGQALYGDSQEHGQVLYGDAQEHGQALYEDAQGPSFYQQDLLLDADRQDYYDGFQDTLNDSGPIEYPSGPGPSVYPEPAAPIP